METFHRAPHGPLGRAILARRRWCALGLSLSLVPLAACGPSDQVSRDLAKLREDLAQQRRANLELRERVERLERQDAAAQPPSPRGAEPRSEGARVEPPRELPVVKLAPSRSSAVNAPPLDTRIALRDPTPEQLARLETGPAVDLTGLAEASDPAAERAFTQALQKYNSGDRRGAAQELRAFVRSYPAHAATDNALYLAGMALVAEGRCHEARRDFETVAREHPQGDAVAGALLALGQCEATLGRVPAARAALVRVVQEHARTPEATRAIAALAELPEPPAGAGGAGAAGEGSGGDAASGRRR